MYIKYESNNNNLDRYKILRMDPKSTLKLKVDSAAVIAGSFQHKLNDYSKLTLCAEVSRVIYFIAYKLFMFFIELII
jgi:hypothetical protein